MFRTSMLCAFTAASISAVAFADIETTVDFEELGAPYPSYPTNSGFVSKGVGFTGAPYSGWVYSNGTDTTSPGFLNLSAIPGAGVSATAKYGVASGDGSFINLPAGQRAQSIYLTNTTYSFLAVRDGNDGNTPAFVKGPFGGTSGDDPDYFSVTLTGYAAPNGGGPTVGTAVEFVLADYRFADNASDYVIDSWELVDLTPLGNAVSIGLTFASTDTSVFGGVTYVNTPAYVALDNLVTIPEPTSLACVAVAAGIAMRRRSRN